MSRATLELIEAGREIVRLQEELAKVQKQLEMERAIYAALAELLRQTTEMIGR